MDPVSSSNVSAPTVTRVPGNCMYEPHSELHVIQSLPPMHISWYFTNYLPFFMHNSRNYPHRCSFNILLVWVNIPPPLIVQQFNPLAKTTKKVLLGPKYKMFNWIYLFLGQLYKWIAVSSCYSFRFDHKGHQSFCILLVQTSFVTEPKAKLPCCYPWRSTWLLQPAHLLLYCFALPASCLQEPKRKKHKEK